MAHALATGDYVCNVDADNFLGLGFADYLRGVFRRRPNAIVARTGSTAGSTWPAQGCMGRVALSKENFDLLGGYDESERFRGWSGEDSDLVIRAVRKFLRPVFIRDRRFLRVVQHADLDRVGLTEFSDARRTRQDRASTAPACGRSCVTSSAARSPRASPTAGRPPESAQCRATAAAAAPKTCEGLTVESSARTPDRVQHPPHRVRYRLRFVHHHHVP